MCVWGGGRGWGGGVRGDGGVRGGWREGGRNGTGYNFGCRTSPTAVIGIPNTNSMIEK